MFNDHYITLYGGMMIALPLILIGIGYYLGEWVATRRERVYLNEYRKICDSYEKTIRDLKGCIDILNNKKANGN